MVPTIISFSNFLADKGHSFKTLCNVTVIEEQGQPIISRTALFAEAQISMEGRRYLLCMPLNGHIDSHLEHICVCLERMEVASLTEYRLLKGEIMLPDSMGNKISCDLILHALPEGERLDYAATHVATQRLRRAVALLKSDVLEHGFLHNNLKVANLIYGDDGRLYPIRYHYARLGAPAESILEEIKQIEEFIATVPEIAEIGEYISPAEYEKHLPFDRTFPLQDTMRRICKDGLYGYLDGEHRVVIEPQFTYAEDFFENRAIVQTRQGKMGVIDHRCRYVIEPVYDMLGFEDGIFEARLGNQWLKIDYLGKIIE